jgi:hypothetical protein
MGKTMGSFGKIPDLWRFIAGDLWRLYVDYMVIMLGQ